MVAQSRFERVASVFFLAASLSLPPSLSAHSKNVTLASIDIDTGRRGPLLSLPSVSTICLSDMTPPREAPKYLCVTRISHGSPRRGGRGRDGRRVTWPRTPAAQGLLPSPRREKSFCRFQNPKGCPNKQTRGNDKTKQKQRLLQK